jgi:hypothetical protein
MNNCRAQNQFVPHLNPMTRALPAHSVPPLRDFRLRRSPFAPCPTGAQVPEGEEIAFVHFDRQSTQRVSTAGSRPSNSRSLNPKACEPKRIARMLSPLPAGEGQGEGQTSSACGLGIWPRRSSLAVSIRIHKELVNFVARFLRRFEVAFCKTVVERLLLSVAHSGHVGVYFCRRNIQQRKSVRSNHAITGDIEAITSVGDPILPEILRMFLAHETFQRRSGVPAISFHDPKPLPMTFSGTRVVADKRTIVRHGKPRSEQETERERENRQTEKRSSFHDLRLHGTQNHSLASRVRHQNQMPEFVIGVFELLSVFWSFGISVLSRYEP